MPNWMQFIGIGIGVGFGVGLFGLFGPWLAHRLTLALRRRRYVREHARLTADEPPRRLTREQESAAIAQAESSDKSTRAKAYVTRYAADMIRAGVPAKEAEREGQRMWDDINLVG